jgi:S-adenosylmethionine synthetase
MRAILTAFHEELTPAGIIKKFELWNPIYRETAAFGHFGRTPYEKKGMKFFPWENLDPKYNEVLSSIK